MDKAQELDAVKTAILDMLRAHTDSDAVNECVATARRLVRDVDRCDTDRDRLIMSCAMLIACTQLEKDMPKI